MEISSEVVLKSLAIHKITEDDGLVSSNQAITVEDEDLNQLLVKFFFKAFRAEERYRFGHETSLEYNEIFSFVSEIFDAPGKLHEKSVEISKHLYANSRNQNIKDGDVMVTYFEDCVVGDEITDAVGIFKVENKDTYIKIMGHAGVFDITSEEGISINKLDKGLIVFNTDQETGYQCLLVDKTNKSGNAQYWQNDFLNVEPFNDEYFKTQNVINNLQEFAQEAFAGQTKTDKIAFVNESIDYMKSKDHFDSSDYQEAVLQAPELIEHFENFREKKQEEQPEMDLDTFNISKPAVKNTKRFIRSVIKLDKNFHVYVHGNRQNIERGFDENRRQNFYTLYFESEE
ncbi:MAG: nucleoid-associated protein [Reichenbachiella sp.]|uniref:nucleoid-associated protein n=1 Tax=Reichenbachiella sp. TaxID=2184521 RepID=UPI0032636817